METVRCNLCGSDDHALVYEMPDVRFPDEPYFKVVECRSCGLGFVNPRPTVEEMARHYPPGFYDALARENAASRRARHEVQASLLTDVQRTREEPRLLDIGCAHGYFARAMQERGWIAEGVDLYADLEKPMGFTVYDTWFPDIPVHEPRYDAITAWAVMEHVHDPRAYFEKAAQILAPGGRFVFLVTNFQSLASRHLFCEDVPRHLYFFSEKTVQRYLEEVGLRLERSHYSKDMFTMPPRLWLYYYTSRLLGRPFDWPRPDTYSEYVRRHKLPRGVSSFARFSLRSPLSLFDRMALPLVERVQIWRGSYGIVTFLATKPC